MNDNPAVENGEQTKTRPNRKQLRAHFASVRAKDGKYKAKLNERNMKLKAHRNYKED